MDGRGAVNVRFLTKVDPEKVGPSFDIEPILRKVLDTTELFLGQEDPAPPHILAEVIQIDDSELRKFASPTEAPKETQEKKKTWAEMRAEMERRERTKKG
jgi:hypothetical protein